MFLYLNNVVQSGRIRPKTYSLLRTSFVFNREACPFQIRRLNRQWLSGACPYSGGIKLNAEILHWRSIHLAYNRFRALC